MVMNRKEAIKELQNLYSWEDFYTQNNRVENLEKTKKQILEFKDKHNLK